jgi:predicted GNAT family N-acyltransferase
MADDPTIVFQGPVNLDGYDRSVPALEQNTTIPPAFLDAMAVREGVFVKEQGVPLLMEADPDDCRSCHWIAYGSLPGRPQTSPAGTVRLVPFPHDPHPEPGWSWDIDTEGEGTDIVPKPMPYIIDRSTTFHDGLEPYIKLGRWAVLKDFRGRGIANLLIKTALDWAKRNPEYFNPSGADRSRLGMDAHRTKWNGLVCVHAQEYLVNAWAKFGFQVDEEMGRWTEAGIPHVGMFLRLNISKSDALEEEKVKAIPGAA